MCGSSGNAVTDAELETAMAQLDVDNSGEVDQEEFTKYFKEHRQEKEGGVMAGMMALFAALQQEEAATAAEGKVTCISPQMQRQSQSGFVLLLPVCLHALVFRLFFCKCGWVGYDGAGAGGGDW